LCRLTSMNDGGHWDGPRSTNTRPE
jgi:hypothetical protein